MGVPVGLSHSNAESFGGPEQKAVHWSRESQRDYCQCKIDSLKRSLAFVQQGDLTHTQGSLFHLGLLLVHIGAFLSPGSPFCSSPVRYLPLIPAGMWLWLWRWCPMCALQSQSLQRGPQPAEMQTLSRLFTSQPLPEGQLLHHKQRRVRRLPARVSQTEDGTVTACLRVT